jgi:SAM-dependent methyltransferase
MADDAASDWRDRGALFDLAPDEYVDGRPGYPDELFGILRERCGLADGAAVLEVGAGAGQASLPMLAAGARLTVVEPGRALAERIVRRTVGMDVRIIVETFEDADLPVGAFDIVAAATAFHWVDPDVGYVKYASILRAGGWLALWWNVFGDDDRPDPFHEALQTILEAKAPQLAEEGGAAASYAFDARARIGEIERTASFGSVEQHVIRWEGRHGPEELRRMFATFSPWLALAESVREDLLDDVATLARDDFSGLVARPYQTVLYLAQRLG